MPDQPLLNDGSTVSVAKVTNKIQQNVCTSLVFTIEQHLKRKAYLSRNVIQQQTLMTK